MRLLRSERIAALVDEQARVLASLDCAPAPVVLDVGCADGRAYSRELARFAGVYIGLELDISALRVARDVLGATCHFTNGNAESIPFRSACFDLVVVNDMLAYCDKSRVLEEICRVLKPGGTVLSLHNNSPGWSLYKMRYPEKPMFVEIAHSLVVLANTLVQSLTGWRFFRTTANTRRNLNAALGVTGLQVESIWSTRRAYTWWHFVARKPREGVTSTRGIALITGSYLSQNMGAAAMTIVAAEHLSQLGYEPVLLAKYPGDDALLASRYGIRVQPSNQYLFTFAVIPALLLLSPFLGVRHWIRRRWFGDAALCFDLGGITFASSRGASGFVINLTWTLLPLLLGIPFVKGAQAMGPFDRWYLRSAPWILRRAKHLHARGAHTWRILRQHRVSSRVTPDVAFLLEAEPTAVPQESYVCLVPSSVVRQRYDDVHGEGSYIALLAGLARHLLARGESILIVPHCYRDGEGENSNDVPLCKALHAALDGSGVSLYPSAGKTPGELKFVLGQSVAVISSRFHAMVAALSMQVPVVVTSWSHKYREVLDMFDMGKWAYDWRELNLGALCSGVDHLLHDRENLRKEIGRRLPAVRADARANFACLPERTVALPR